MIRNTLPAHRFSAHVLSTLLLTLFLLTIPGRLHAVQDTTDTVYNRLELFANVLALLEQHYVDEVDPQDLITEAVNGMLSSLDPHSSYLSPEDFRELHEETQGSFTGIGLEITIRNNILTVVAPIEGTPAAAQGIQAGDQIIRIDGEPTKNMSLMDAVKKMRGEKGTPVTLTLFTAGEEEIRQVTIIRDNIPIQSVKAFELEPQFLYTRIANFQSTTTRDFRREMRKASKTKPLKGLVMDLRNNPGGLLDQAVKISDIFINEGVIVSTRGRDDKEGIVFNAHKGGVDDIPIVVLVNGGSASGSEIVAGALRDHKRAIILGTTTFGKGSVQTILPMPDGSGIRLTTARYYTPNGDSIQARGIEPDIVVPLHKPEPYAEQEEIDPFQLSERNLHNHMENENGSGPETTELPDQDQALEKTEVQDETVKKRLAEDNQLRMALIILKSLNIVSGT